MSLPFGPCTVGIDNGSTGSIGVIRPGGSSFFQPVPTQDYLHYGKRGSIGQRLDRDALRCFLEVTLGLGTPYWPGFDGVKVYIERPFSGKFINAVVPAHRFFEATIIALEDFGNRHGLGYEVVDSGVWQKSVLGNVKGSPELKKASKLRGLQLYPQHREAITKQGDADGLLIAHYFHRLCQPT